MSNITYKTITSLEEAKTAWQELSPNHYLHDDWNFRYLYYKYFNYPLYFYAAYEGDKLVALLPLMLNEQLGKLEFFAGFDYMENNRIFVKSGFEKLKQILINQIDKPYRLDYMEESMENISGVEIHDDNFYIDLSEMNDYEDFINKYLSTKSRQNLKSQLNKINSQYNPVCSLSKNLNQDLDLLRTFNLSRFGERSSYFDRPYWGEYIKEICSLFNSRLIVLKIKEEKIGIGLSINYNDITYGINVGYKQNINNLGKLMTMLKIDRSIKDGMKIYDSLGGGAYGWKTDFHLLTRPFFLLESNE